ncbi:MAG: PH domain-containing protein [Actinomycetales bacterium]|nr:PH domain-containing protein [Actinomycetales bacterium]
MGPTLTFRTNFARVLAVVIAVVTLAALYFFAAQGGVRELLRSGPTALLGAALGWALFWRPQVEVSDGGITITNILRTIHVPWPAFKGVDSQWSLRVETPGRTFTAWAVPASSGMASRVRSTPRAALESAQTPGRRALTEGGNADAAALAIAERLHKLRAAGYLKGTPREEIRPTVTPNRAVITVLAALAALSVAGLVLG